MRSRLLAVSLSVAALAVSGGVLASVMKGLEPVAPTDAERRVADESVYERITAEKPEVRAEIKRLYAEDRAMQETTLEKLTELEMRMQAEKDWEARKALVSEARSLKEDLELSHIEIGLRIAELNGDDQRVADFARALDQLQNPEKYRRPLADPSIEAERKRQQGQ